MRGLLFMLLAGCGSGSQELPDDAPTDGQRLDLPRIHFNTWTDFLSIQAALDADCVFMEPLKDNHSTAWPPLQVFWVIYDDDKDVKDGDVVEDTYFVGDVVRASDYADKNGVSAKGFKFVPPLQQSFLSIEYTDIRDEGRTLEAGLGSPIDAALLITAEPGDTDCGFTTQYCEQPCEEGWRPLDRIELDLGLFYAVQDLRFIEP